jgi:hypothetical protein
MTDMMNRLRLILLTALLATLITGCKSSDDEDINDILPGTWVLDTSVENGKGYVITPDDGTEYMIDHLELTADGHFTLVYDQYDSDSGTYEAGNAYIRFDYSDQNKKNEPLLWQVLSFSGNTLNASYRDTGRDLAVTVWLRKK